MEIFFKITEKDASSLQKFIKENRNPLVESRIHRNINKNDIIINEDIIIKALTMCILTTQQRSGPNSPVANFLILDPFPFTNTELKRQTDLETFLQDTFKANRLTRYLNRNTRFFINNINHIRKDNWATVFRLLDSLVNNDSPELERKVADEIAVKFEGIGHKQSRNFLQFLGLTKYEIPIDSRIIKWLNDFGFPIALSAGALQDKAYYHFILDGIQKLCQKAGVYPCVLDAAIFSSYDKEGWSADNLVY